MAVSWFWHDCALVLSWQTLHFGPRPWHMLQCRHVQLTPPTSCKVTGARSDHEASSFLPAAHKVRKAYAKTTVAG